MKKFFLLIFLILITGNSNFIFSRDSTTAKYLPLQVGNIWVYRTYVQGPTWICYAYEKYSITGTILLGNKTYCVVSRALNLYNPICSVWSFPVASRLFRNIYLRIDSLTSNIYSTDTCVIDSLASAEGDSVRVCAYYYTPVVCDTSTQFIFGFYKPAKTFISSNFETSEVMWYIKDFGFVRYHLSQPGPSGRDMLLRGCVLNGIVYGDTNTLVGINQISSEVPNEYMLYQNYPNPFNPVTTIKFIVPELSNIKLSVYDVLGREVTTLINEQMKPGSYEVEWDASNYPSGVYFYRLESGTYTKKLFKMVLIK